MPTKKTEAVSATTSISISRSNQKADPQGGGLKLRFI
jgi:hypothetical protein